MGIQRKKFARGVLERFCLEGKKYHRALADAQQLLLPGEDRLRVSSFYLPFGNKILGKADHYVTNFPYRCYPFVYTVQHDNFLEHLNNLEWGFLESHEALWLSQTPNRLEEIGVLIFDTSPGFEKVIEDINTAFKRRGIYSMLNIQLAAYHIGDPEFLYNQLMYSPDITTNIAYYTSFVTIYQTYHPLLMERRTVRFDPWSFMKLEETEEYLSTIRRHVSGDYSL